MATIDTATGLATATGDGSTTITATTGPVSGTATLTVSLVGTVATVDVSPATAQLTALGATQQFTAVARDGNGNVVPGVTFTWASTDGAVATIDAATGLGTAVGNGPTAITATVGGVAGSADLTVGQVIADILIQPDSATLLIPDPQTLQFTAVARDANGFVVAGVVFGWTSSDPSVATVTATGLAATVGPGTTTITASAGGVTDTASLTVIRRPPPVP